MDTDYGRGGHTRRHRDGKKLATKMHTMHKGIGLNRQDAKVSEEDLPRTHAALTGRCRSGGSVDTLTGKLIRLSGCPPIHVRIANSAAWHSGQPVFLVNLRQSGTPICSSSSPFISVHPCSSVVHSLLLLLGFLAVKISFWLTLCFLCLFVAIYPGSASICGFFLGVLAVQISFF